MRLRAAAGVTCLTVGLAIAGPAAARAPRAATTSPTAYLRAAPLQDPEYIAWAMLGLESAGVRPPAAMVSYVVRHESSDASVEERAILALAPIGQPVSALAARLARQIRADGSIGEETVLTSFGVMALRAAGRPIPARTADWLAAQQDSDGGYNYARRGGSSDDDDTGAALEGLVAARSAGVQIPGLSARLTRAVKFIDAAQNRDGGLPSEPGESSNAQSTAWAVQGLIAVDRHPTRAQAYLRARVTPSGAINYAKGQSITPVWVTGQALMGITGRPLPLKPL